MRRLISALILSTALGAGLPARADTDVSFSLSIGERDGFYMGLSNYYGVPRDRVILLVDEGLPYEDVTVALYIADLAGVDPFEVADLRLSGMRWIDISHYYGLGADVYYVEVEPYGPYVSYYEPFRRYPRSSWASIELSDVAIVNLANLQFEVQHYGVSARHVMDWRARGDNFLRINHNLFRERGRMPMRPMARHRVQPQPLPEQLKEKARQHRGGRMHREDRSMPSQPELQPGSVDVPRSDTQRAERRRQRQPVEQPVAPQVEERRQPRRERVKGEKQPQPVPETQEPVEVKPADQEQAPQAAEGEKGKSKEKGKGRRNAKPGKRDKQPDKP